MGFLWQFPNMEQVVLRMSAHEMFVGTSPQHFRPYDAHLAIYTYELEVLRRRTCLKKIWLNVVYDPDHSEKYRDGFMAM